MAELENIAYCTEYYYGRREPERDCASRRSFAGVFGSNRMVHLPI